MVPCRGTARPLTRRVSTSRMVAGRPPSAGYPCGHGRSCPQCLSRAPAPVRLRRAEHRGRAADGRARHPRGRRHRARQPRVGSTSSTTCRASSPVSPLAQQSRILDADGRLIANPYDENRIIVPLKKISKNMQNAQIAIEDSRFYKHGGLDMRGFSRAMISNLQGGDVQGASTLTQQFVKITLQENALKKGDKERREGRHEQDVLAQAPGAQVRAERRGELHQGPDPRGLPQPRLLRRPGLRRRGGRTQLLRRQCQQAQPGAGRPARRRRAAADGLQPGAQPEGGRGPAQRRARPDADAGPGHRQGRHRGQEGPGQEDDQEAAGQGRVPPLPAALLLRVVLEYLQKSPQMAVLGKTPPTGSRRSTRAG